MTLKQMRYFVVVADSGSISEAARKLHISQPPLSMQIRALEEEFGTTLLERTTHHFRLTGAGQIFYDKARAMLDLAEETVGELTASAQNIEGRLVIGSISSCGNIFLTHAFAEFAAKYPALDFELVEGHSLAMIEKIKKREIDLAFLRTPFDDEGLDCRYFEAEPMAAAGLQKYFDSRDSSSTEDTSSSIPLIRMEELSRKPLILYKRFEKLIRTSFRRRGLEIRVKCLNEDARTSLMWAGAGIGVCIIPLSIASPLPAPGMVLRRIDCPELTTSVAIACRQGQYLSPAARKFLEVYEDATSPERPRREKGRKPPRPPA